MSYADDRSVMKSDQKTLQEKWEACVDIDWMLARLQASKTKRHRQLARELRDLQYRLETELQVRKDDIALVLCGLIRVMAPTVPR